MFGLFKRKKADVLNHWYVLVPDFRVSTQEFYAAVEQELKVREVPALELTRVDFSEGGLLSYKREYLRMTRERLVFDVCAAPFGTAYFFSCRFAELPAVVRLWQILLLLMLLALIYGGLWKQFGLVPGAVILGCSLLAFGWLARNSVSIGLQDLDTILMRAPVVGPVYERFLRKETYYRQDTRLMYLETVETVVRLKVDEFTLKKGIKLQVMKQQSPLLDLYRSFPWSLGNMSEPSAKTDQA